MKKKIFTYISILTLSFCLLVAGVYAAKTASLTSTGTVSFTASNCKIAITAITCTGHSSTNEPNALPEGGLVLESKGSKTTEEFNLGNLMFDDINSSGDTVSPIVISITVKNNSDWAIQMEYSVSVTDDTNVKIEADKTTSTINKNESQILTVTLSTKEASPSSGFDAKGFTISIKAAK